MTQTNTSTPNRLNGQPTRIVGRILVVAGDGSRSSMTTDSAGGAKGRRGLGLRAGDGATYQLDPYTRFPLSVAERADVGRIWTGMQSSIESTSPRQAMTASLASYRAAAVAADRVDTGTVWTGAAESGRVLFASLYQALGGKPGPVLDAVRARLDAYLAKTQDEPMEEAPGGGDPYAGKIPGAEASDDLTRSDVLERPDASGTSATRGGDSTSDRARLTPDKRRAVDASLAAARASTSALAAINEANAAFHAQRRPHEAKRWGER